MAGETDVSICSQALIRLGDETISSMTDETERATICANAWPNLKKALLLKYPWRRTLRKVALDRLVATPTNEYDYAYQLPSDMLADGPREVWNDNTADAGTVSDFKIFDRQLYTDTEEVVIDYQVDIAEGDFAPHLVEMSILALAAEIALPVTDKATMAEYFHQKAWGLPSEGGVGGYYRTARQLDATIQPNNVIDDYTLIHVRQEGVRA